MTQQNNSTFDRRAVVFRNAVEAALDALRSASARAETEHSEKDLDAMRQALSTLLFRVEQGTLPPRGQRYRVLTRQTWIAGLWERR